MPEDGFLRFLFMLQGKSFSSKNGVSNTPIITIRNAWAYTSHFSSFN